MARKNDILSIYTKEVEGIKEAGLFKGEAPFVSPQGARVKMEDGRELLCMCANNYLGLGDNPRLIEAAKRTYDEKGYGVASVRFICGTQDIHKKLEKKISGFLGTDDTILYSSCFDANGGLFETILTAEDAVISDELNHASIIDGVRLCKAKRFRYKNNDMEDLEAKLKEADEAGARIKLIATDGVFSMDGIICNLKGVCDLADKYNALVMVDDSHAVGFVGKNGCGKTTLMKIIDGRIKPDSGNINIGQTIKMGYYTQEIENDKDAGIAYMDSEDRVIDYIKNTAEFVRTEEGLVSASVMLERFLFPSSQQYSKIGKLSGGERRRLNLLRVLMEAPNVLILDEPTNDLDIETMTILEDYLDSFDGIVITVSHDRYFLDRVVRRIFSFEGNGVIRQYEGGYTDYINRKKEKKRAEKISTLIYMPLA